MTKRLDLAPCRPFDDALRVAAARSADPRILRAAFTEALASGRSVLVETSADRVNPVDGDSGLTPAGFADRVRRQADAIGLPRSRLLLGGADLGPGRWASSPSEVAMTRAETMVADYVVAGFRELHLDGAIACLDDPVALPERLVAARTARLCLAAEAAYAALLGGRRGEAPVYLIGGRRPVAGGDAGDAGDAGDPVAAAACRLLACHRDAFVLRGLGQGVWRRVVHLVADAGSAVDADAGDAGAPARVRFPGSLLEACGRC